MGDFRIYYYESGSLRKVDNRFRKLHKCDSLPQAVENIKLMKLNKRNLDKQYIVAEYLDSYKSKIVLLV
mgnify:CR=1 FL=1